MEIGLIIRQLREEKEMSQLQLAKIIGVSRSALAMYETNSRFPSSDVLEAYADYFNVDMDYLMGRTKIRKKIHFDTEGNEYYNVDDETKILIEKIKYNKELKDIFNALSTSNKDELKKVHSVIIALKQK